MRGRLAHILSMFVASALCWWPLLIEPNLDLTWWLPLACVALTACLSTVLCSGTWAWSAAASAVGTVCGLCAGYSIWWPTDPIAGPWVPISVAINTALAVVVAVIASVGGRRVRLSTPLERRAAYIALAGCIAFGPVALALTKPVVAHRIALNDRVASQRFESLKTAAQQTASESDSPVRLCDGSVLKRHYSGPRFSDEDWRRITANYVRQDGYFFMVYCREQGGYTIDARPARHVGDGTRHLCTDESGRIGCGMKFDGARYACAPCDR